MEKTFEAVYEGGCLRPLAPLDLAEGQHVQITLTGIDEGVSACFDPGEWEASKHDDISLQAVRAALSSIEGSLSDAVIASREERY